MKDLFCFFTYNKSCKTALLRLKNGHTMRPLILLPCREKKLSQAVLPSSQSKSSLADHSRRAQCGGPVFFVLIAAFSPLYIFLLIVAHCQCWLPTMWQLPTETCMTFFLFWFEYPSPTSWKPKSWNFWRVAKKNNQKNRWSSLFALPGYTSFGFPTQSPKVFVWEKTQLLVCIHLSECRFRSGLVSSCYLMI